MYFLTYIPKHKQKKTIVLIAKSEVPKSENLTYRINEQNSKKGKFNFDLKKQKYFKKIHRENKRTDHLSFRSSIQQKNRLSLCFVVLEKISHDYRIINIDLFSIQTVSRKNERRGELLFRSSIQQQKSRLSLSFVVLEKISHDDRIIDIDLLLIQRANRKK